MPEPIAVFSSRWLLPFIEVLDELGVAVEPLLEAANVPLEAVYEDRVMFEQPIWAFVELAARASRTPGLGFRVAESTGLDHYPEFVKRLDACPTIAHLVAEVAAESPLSDYRLQRIEGILVFSRRGSPIQVGSWEVEQYAVTLMIQIVRRVAGPEWRPRIVRLQSPTGAGLEESTYLRGADVQLGSRLTAVSVPEQDAIPGWLGPVASRIGVESGTSRSEWNEVLVRVLEPHLTDGYPSLDLTARILEVGPRTLQRRLLAAHSSYTEVIERARFRKAARLLATTDLPLSRISNELGYHQQSSFSRAFRSWSGLAPREFRRQGRGAAGGRF